MHTWTNRIVGISLSMSYMIGKNGFPDEHEASAIHQVITPESLAPRSKIGGLTQQG